MNKRTNSPLQNSQDYIYTRLNEVWYENMPTGTTYYMIFQLDNLEGIRQTAGEDYYKYLDSGKITPYGGAAKINLSKYIKVNYDNRISVSDKIYMRSYYVNFGFKFLIMFGDSDLSYILSDFTKIGNNLYNTYSSIIGTENIGTDEIDITQTGGIDNINLFVGDVFYIQSTSIDDFGSNIEINYDNGTIKLVNANNPIGEDNNHIAYMTEILITSEIDSIYVPDYNLININNCSANLVVRYIDKNLKVTTLPFTGRVNKTVNIENITAKFSTKSVQLNKNVTEKLKANTGLIYSNNQYLDFARSMYYAIPSDNVSDDINIYDNKFIINYYTVNMWDSEVNITTSNMIKSADTTHTDSSTKYTFYGTRNTAITQSCTFTFSPLQSNSTGYIFTFQFKVNSGSTFRLYIDNVLYGTIGTGYITFSSTSDNPVIRIEAASTTNGQAFNFNLYSCSLYMNSEYKPIDYKQPKLEYYWKDVLIDFQNADSINGLMVGERNKEIEITYSDRAHQGTSYVNKGFFD